MQLTGTSGGRHGGRGQLWTVWEQSLWFLDPICIKFLLCAASRLALLAEELR